MDITHDSRTEHPGVIEVALSSLDQENLEVMIEVGQAACNNTSATSTTAYNDVELLWHGAEMARIRVGSRHGQIYPVMRSIIVSPSL
jgi:hypothetical protein